MLYCWRNTEGEYIVLIKLTFISGKDFWINPELVERVFHDGAETTICFNSGKVGAVKESVEEAVALLNGERKN